MRIIVLILAFFLGCITEILIGAYVDREWTVEAKKVVEQALGKPNWFYGWVTVWNIVPYTTVSFLVSVFLGFTHSPHSISISLAFSFGLASFTSVYFFFDLVALFGVQTVLATWIANTLSVSVGLFGVLLPLQFSSFSGINFKENKLQVNVRALLFLTTLTALVLSFEKSLPNVSRAILCHLIVLVFTYIFWRRIKGICGIGCNESDD